MLAAIAAASQGWRSHYLGADLPAEEIAFSAQKMSARAVAISIIYPPADENIREQLLLLHRLLPDDTTLIVSGRAVASYADTLETINAKICHDMTELRQQLLWLRSKSKNRL